MDNDLRDLIAQLDRDAERYRWHQSLIELLDELERTTEDPPSPRSRAGLGIDLAAKHEDIRRLTWKFGLRACRTNGWNLEEDLLSDVFAKIATGNVGTNPFDPSRSTFGHYVVMVIRAAIVNRWRRETKRGKVRRHVAIDDPECRLHLRDGLPFDAALDLWRMRGQDAETFDALVDHEGTVAKVSPDRDGREYVSWMREEMVAALHG